MKKRRRIVYYDTPSLFYLILSVNGLIILRAK